MPLHARSIAVSIAVIFFFGISTIGWISGLSPFVCCKRAAIGAFLAYVAATLAVRVINTILTNAIVAEQIRQSQEQDSDNQD